MPRVVLNDLAVSDGLFNLVPMDGPSNPLLGTVNGVPVVPRANRLGDQGHRVLKIVAHLQVWRVVVSPMMQLQDGSGRRRLIIQQAGVALTGSVGA